VIQATAARPTRQSDTQLSKHPDLPLVQRCAGVGSGHTGIVMDESRPKAWVLGFPARPPLKDSPDRLIAEGGGSDAASNAYYQFEVNRANDPTYVRQEAARRRFRGQYLRRLRRLRQREMHHRT
jgi:hypothetical protein